MKKINSFFVMLFVFNSTFSMAQSVVTNRNGKEITVNSPASTSAQGQVQLAGDLAGTADAPTVPALTNKLEGTGTLNYVPKFSASKTLTNSLIFDNGTNVGVGTTSPGNKFEITQGTAGNSGLRFTNLNSTSTATTSLSKVLALNSTGDVILTNVPGTQNIVAFSTATPTTSGVVFTPNTPADESVLYQSAVDNSMWTYNGTSYVTYTAPASTAWFTAGTTNDAGNSKTSSIYRTGNVGVRNNNPSAPLVVQGVTGTGALKLVAPSVAAGDNWWLGFGHGTTSTDANDRARIGVDVMGGGAGRLFFTTGPTGSQNRAMFIDESQRVGINTSTPESRLHVRFENGALSPTFERISTGSVASTSLKFLLNTSTTTLASQTASSFGQGIHFAYKSDTEAEKSVGAITSKITDYANNKGELLFIVNANTTSGSPAMIIKDSGNIGIGTTTAPVSKLEVNGTVGALVRSSSVSTTTANDFTLLMTAANTTVTLEAPTAVTRRIMVIKNTSTGRINVTGHIDGTASTTFVLLSKESIEIQSDGTTWQIIAKYNSPVPLAVTAQLNVVSIPNSTNTNMTSYTNVSDTSQGAWNPTTGIYTCNKTGVYRLEFRAMFASASWTQGREVNAQFFKNDVNVQSASWFASSTYTQYAFSGHNFATLNLVVGDQIKVVIWHNAGGSRTTHLRQFSTLSINEVR
jgi:C1q domain